MKMTSQNLKDTRGALNERKNSRRAPAIALICSSVVDVR